MTDLSNKLAIHFDGICKNKILAYAFIIRNIDKEEIIYSNKGVVLNKIHATINYAEYCALGFSLKYLIDRNWHGKELHIFSDSQLVINQIGRSWRCKQPHLIKLRDRCLDYLQEIGSTFKMTWISHDKNQETEKLAWRAYHEYIRQ